MDFAGFSVFALAIFAVILITIFMGAVVVSQGYEFTVERMGKYTKTLKPGFHLIIPYIDRIGAKVNVKERVLDIPSQEVITKDNAMVRIDGVVFFQVLDTAMATYEVNDLGIAIMNLSTTNLRTVVGSMELDELLSKRDEISGRLLMVVDEATNPWGVKITRVEVKDIEPPQDIIDSMARQLKAERDKRAAILEAEGHRQAQVLRAEGEKKSAILEAEGRREAAFRDAEARERSAEAEAKATEVVSEAIAKGDAQAINYFVAQKYVEALGKFATSNNEKLVFMPLEASGIIGSIGGINELVKGLGGKAGAGRAGASVPNAGD
ncbi:SPFH domain-containing protein [Kordiimonas marina]|uniref:SPFH domain-containing protein n=1 Tax=Kordiimonas marina TaxID=2872312 RepID=UPI001FF60C5F|nr:SPFH domain-containing protein [Kordiimonas marina]MCJ9428876.1 SPFH/Band 7/PHB domain protein [Kordiimonas marina]